MGFGRFSMPDMGGSVQGSIAKGLDEAEQTIAKRDERERLAEQHELSQEKGKFGLERQKIEAQQSDTFHQMKMKSYEFADKLAKQKGIGALYNQGIDAIEIGPGAKIGVDFIYAAHLMSGNPRADNGAIPVDVEPAKDEHERPGYYLVDIYGKRVTAGGKELFVQAGVRQEEKIQAQNEQGGWRLENGIWRRFGPPKDDTVKLPAGQGKAPAGYEYFKDPKTNQLNLRPIPGGPAARKIAAADEKSAMIHKEAIKSSKFVFAQTNRALEALEAATSGGFIGWLTQDVPLPGRFGGYTLEQLLDPIRANIGFKQLQDMRAASPTGGALGQVSDRENKLLQSIKGSLVQGDPVLLRENLMALRELYLDVWFGADHELDLAVAEERMSATDAAELKQAKAEARASGYTGFNQQGQPTPGPTDPRHTQPQGQPQQGQPQQGQPQQPPRQGEPAGRVVDWSQLK